MADMDGGIDGSAEIKAGAAPVEANHRQSRPASNNKGRQRPKSLGHTLHWFAYIGQEPELESDYHDYDDTAGALAEPLQELPHAGDAGSRDGSAAPSCPDREERARQARERQNGERARKLEELRAQALAAQRFREQKEDERRRRIDEMRNRDNDRRHQVEERKRAIWEAERERREAIVRRNEEREARLEGRRRGAGAAGVFAFGSSTPRMLEPADTGGTFWGHRRATSTSNVMFAALPLSRRSSERELDPSKKRATSASGLDRQAGDEEASGDGAPWSRVARRRTDIVPTIPAPRADVRTPRSPGRAYSMTRLDQLARPRRPASAGQEVGEGPAGPVRPPRQRGQLSRAAGHRSVGNLLVAVQGPAPPPRKHSKQASGLRSGEVTPGSPSRPGSSLSSASTVAGSSSTAMTSSVMGTLVNRRPRAAPRRPRPASIAGTGVTTPPHVKTNTVGADGKPVGVRAEKPPLPRVHSASTTKKGPPVPVPDKPEVPKRAHKGGSVKASPRLTPRTTPLQSPASDLPPSFLQDVQETVTMEQEESAETSLMSESQTTESQVSSSTVSSSTVTETIKQITKEVDGEVTTVETVITHSDGDLIPSVTETATDEKTASIATGLKNLKIKEETTEISAKMQEAVQVADPTEIIDMTASMSARGRGVITTEEEAKAALAERRRLAREEAERQAERERLRLEKEAEEEEESQRQEEERQRRLEEETIRLSQLQRQAEEERLQQAILEAQRRTEEENQRRESEARARAERELAEVRAREDAERVRKETVERLRREEEEREARRKRVEAIMLRTRQAKQKKDGDKSPTEENKSLEEADQKFIENKMVAEEVDQQPSAPSIREFDSESAYELSVREKEEALLNYAAPHNLAQRTGIEPVAASGLGSFHNGTAVPTNGDSAPPKERLLVETELSQSNTYAVQNGHSKSQMNELNSFINTSENQYNNVALDNAVIQNNVSNNLLDMSEMDLLNSTNKNNPFLVDINTNGSTLMQPHQIDGSTISQMATDAMTKNFVNEDSMNSNQTSNSPFITSFQDNQDNRDVSLL